MPATLPTTRFMAQALALAAEAGRLGEVPVGAVLVAGDGSVLAATANRVERDLDPTAHAELLAIRMAATLRGEKHLVDCELFVSLEPCAMCAAAIALARLKRVTFGAYDPKGGAVEHGPRFFTQPTCHHRPDIVGGVEERAAGELLREFFEALRKDDR